MRNRSRSRFNCDLKKIEIGEPRWRAVTRLLIWLSVIVVYYVTIISTDVTDTTKANRGHLNWMFVLLPLFLTPYLFGIMEGIRNREVFVFDGIAGDLRRGGVPVIRFDQITGVCLKAVNGTCEELSLSVRGEIDVSIELPVNGPRERAAELANTIAAMTKVNVQFINS